MKLYTKQCGYVGCKKGEGNTRRMFEGSARKKYCSELCKNYAGQKKWYAKQGGIVTPPQAVTQ